MQVITMRYGLHRQDGRGMTLSDLSVAYDLTQERIRQLEESALHKLRRHKGVLTGHLSPASASAAPSVVGASKQGQCLNSTYAVAASSRRSV